MVGVLDLRSGNKDLDLDQEQAVIFYVIQDTDGCMLLESRMGDFFTLSRTWNYHYNTAILFALDKLQRTLLAKSITKLVKCEKFGFNLNTMGYNQLRRIVGTPICLATHYSYIY
ncbi:hypothetical protein AVEN_163362-1 [Araneus ventricosus]|uniref:Uncharacterized protein n=1 Tax=Araneus ventricosus TaxID=182803 RepID=A0A4Y2CJQ6_ARAVE|nr:hypothetical protein AVEN_144424-1 [Araneus ventricosus]GBM04195.1 hypothetical protein AVEN_163362-1 [Araneus ventricosus]